MANSNQRGRSRGHNNNPAGRNQYSGGIADIARERPFTAAIAAAATVGAGVFLWSRRSQISEQIGTLSDQIADWREGMSDGVSNGRSEEAFAALGGDFSTDRGKSVEHRDKVTPRTTSPVGAVAAFDTRSSADAPASGGAGTVFTGS
ncbi:MAG: hypothetical protein ABIW16_01235 [Sphingomicrobium sp.]